MVSEVAGQPVEVPRGSFIPDGFDLGDVIGCGGLLNRQGISGANALFIASGSMFRGRPVPYNAMLDEVHLNPVRGGAGEGARGASAGGYEWSSLPGGSLAPVHRRAPWLAAADGLAAFGGEDTAAGRRDFLRRLDERAAQEAVATCGGRKPTIPWTRRGSPTFSIRCY